MIIRRIVVSFILLLPFGAIANPSQPTISALPEGAKVVAGDLSKNEFYILGKNESNPIKTKLVENKIKQQPEGAIISAQKIVPVKTPVIPITHIAKANPPKIKKMMHERIVRLTSHEKILASFEPTLKKKSFSTKNSFKPVIKEYREILLSETQHKKLPAAKKIITAAAKPKNIEHPVPTKALLKVIKVVPLRPAVAAAKFEVKLNVREEVQYIMYKGEKRKVISFVPDTKIAKPTSKQIALKPTPDDAHS